MQDNINELVIECKKGSRQAQYTIYKQYSKAMLNTSLRIVNQLEDAEDVLQESFTHAFLKIGTFNGDSTFGAWLKRIVINRSLNHLNKVSLPTENSEELPDQEEESTNEPDYTVEHVKKALAQLPEGYRVILSLYLFEGYDHNEIAEILSIAVSTSKSQYMRGKKKLIEIIKNESFNDKRKIWKIS